MRTGEITEISTNKLRENAASAVSLSFAALIVYSLIIVLSNLISVFIPSASASVKGMNQSGLSTVFSVVFTIILLFPFEIGIKGWYLSLRGEYQSPISAFFYFKGINYPRTVLYCTVKQLAVFASFLLPLLPSIVIASALKVLLSVTQGRSGILFSILLSLFLVLTLLAVIFGFYCILGMFFADYLYIRKTTENPFHAIRLSFQIARGDRRRLIILIAGLLPYFLLCLLGVAIPFVAPKIQSTFAAYADDRIDSYTGGTTCQF